jgi:plastocyanin
MSNAIDHDNLAVPIITGMSAGVALIVIFSFCLTTTIFHPQKQVSIVVIPKDAGNPILEKNFEPKTIKVVIGINNTVEWINQDSTAHALTSNANYVDPISGSFSTIADLRQTGDGFINPGKSFNFTFSQPGSYGYHGEPDPWLQGVVIVLPSS